MSHAFFTLELEGVATFWRIARADGVTLGFTTHDRDLWFDGVLHRAAPGLHPAAIRRSDDLADDAAEVEGALAHDTIRDADLLAGRYDDARVIVGAVDWTTLQRQTVFTGTLGRVSLDANGFAAELRSAKAQLDLQPAPRTSPTCRARFCGPGCNLNPARFTIETQVTGIDRDRGAVQLNVTDLEPYAFGELRWLDGPQAGQRQQLRLVENGWLTLDVLPADETAAGTAVALREGCDRTIATCASRFANAVNFQGEPFLPGNDLLARYPTA